jgi:hypothetical protein
MTEFIGDLSQSRWEQERVQFGRKGSPVAAALMRKRIRR